MQLDQFQLQANSEVEESSEEEQRFRRKISKIEDNSEKQELIRLKKENEDMTFLMERMKN